jgi:hypothetical protein
LFSSRRFARNLSFSVVSHSSLGHKNRTPRNFQTRSQETKHSGVGCGCRFMRLQNRYHSSQNGVQPVRGCG